MNKVLIGAAIALLLAPNNAHASDPSGLAVFVVAGLLLVSAISLALASAFTADLTNARVRRLIRVLSVTVFLSPSAWGAAGNAWPAALVLLFGEAPEKLRALLSVVICTAIGYGVATSMHNKRARDEGPSAAD